MGSGEGAGFVFGHRGFGEGPSQVTVNVNLTDSGPFSSVEQAELAVQRALTVCYPDEAAAGTFMVGTPKLPEEVGAILREISEGGIEGVVGRISSMAGDDQVLGMMDEMMRRLVDQIGVEGDEEAPNDLSGLAELEERKPDEP